MGEMADYINEQGIRAYLEGDCFHSCELRDECPVVNNKGLEDMDMDGIAWLCRCAKCGVRIGCTRLKKDCILINEPVKN